MRKGACIASMIILKCEKGLADHSSFLPLGPCAAAAHTLLATTPTWLNRLNS